MIIKSVQNLTISKLKRKSTCSKGRQFQGGVLKVFKICHILFHMIWNKFLHSFKISLNATLNVSNNYEIVREK